MLKKQVSLLIKTQYLMILKVHLLQAVLELVQTITTRGFSKDDIQSIAEFIKDILISKHSNDNQYLSDFSKKIKEISSKYPLFDNSNSIKNEKVVA